MRLTSDLIGKTVKVWLNHSRPDGPPFAEGKVIGYYDHPSFIIEDADGKQSTHSSQLRVEVVDTLPPEPTALGSMVIDKDGDTWRRSKSLDDRGRQIWYHNRLNRSWAQLNADYGPLIRLARVAWDHVETGVTS